MLPQFPNFKKVEASDRRAVEAFTHRYPPYSDFNFTSLFAWDTSGKRMISELNGNLVVRFTDYSTDEPFFSFLGENEREQTARELIRHAENEGISPILRLVPETSVIGIRPSVLTVQEDRDNFDYVYSIPTLASMAGRALKSKRHLANRFEEEHPDSRLEVMSLADPSIQKNVISVIRKWEEKKQSDNKTYELEHEERAIKCLFETASSHELIIGAIFADDEIRSFTIEELLPQQYSMGHFWKSDSRYAGTYDFLARKMALHFEAQGVAYWNWEQDLGLEGLRRSKSGFQPVSFLKKYIISVK